MKLWLKILISVVTLTLLFALVPLLEVRRAVSQITFPVWIVALGGFIAGHSLGLAKWQMMVNAGRSNLRWFAATQCYAAGLFANLCLPSIVGGDLLRAVLAGKATGRPEAAVLGGLADRIGDMVISGLLICVGGALAGGALTGWRSQVVGLGLTIGLGIGLASLPLIFQRRLSSWPARYRRMIARTLIVLRHLLRNPQTALRALLISFLVQSGFVLLNAWIGRAVGIEVPLSVWFLTWPLAKVAALAPISLGGLGVRDATLAALLAPFGVPPALSLAASLIWQSVLIAGGLLSGLLWWRLSDVRREREAY
ncbi:MAG TPA: lysylphosphatidylglycerol synthase transmembrane domain-containing protein [Blastocatellia bacterium]|nr:lysylphosphatidylglycerol synthase transmembrane domain-containing protein [Blastocatellia bacterium]